MSWKDIENMIKTGNFHGIDRGKDMVYFLKKKGFIEIRGRGKGSHVWLTKIIDDRPVSVCVPLGSIQVGLLKTILKEAKII